MMLRDQRPESGILILVIASILQLLNLCCEIPQDNKLHPNPVSPSYEDVKAAIDRASPGSLITIGEGTATWDKELFITKGVIIMGAGKNKTIIKGNIIGQSVNSVKYIITYQPSNPAANEPFRISGITLDGENKNAAVQISNWTTTPITRVRIDNSIISNCAARAIYIYGTVYGVIDNNEIFHVPSTPSLPFGSNGHDSAWDSLTFDFGTADNLYFEDNTITSNECLIQSDYNGRYCFRFNTINMVYQANGFYPLFDAHGNNGNLHSTMGIEIYENTIVSTYHGGYLVDQRGGKAVVYNNYISAPESVSAGKIREEYYDNVTPPANNTISGQPQHVSESYYWNNQHNGNLVIPFVGGALEYGPPDGIVPRENAHFWYQITNFDGSIGMGVGPLAARPNNCAPGVAYWATDENRLYRCITPNAWTLYYIPYTYPHPLRYILND